MWTKECSSASKRRELEACKHDGQTTAGVPAAPRRIAPAPPATRCMRDTGRGSGMRGRAKDTGRGYVSMGDRTGLPTPQTPPASANVKAPPVVEVKVEAPRPDSAEPAFPDAVKWGSTLSSSASDDSPPKAETKREKRQKIVREMYTTEEVYVRSLQIMIENFKKPLESMIRTGVIESADTEDIRHIFSNIEQLYPINKFMMERLKEVTENWDHNTSTVGELLLKTAPFFRLYAKYDYEKGIMVLDKCMEDCKFAQIVQNLHEDAPGSLSLESLLIMPMSRIPRYNLFLRDLIAKTEEGHCDHKNLASALVKFEDVLEYLDSHIKGT